MIIHSIKVTNFKSIYGTHTFNFDELGGLIKLSGDIGTGKTTLAEALLYALYGNVKEQKIYQLISWNTNMCETELLLTSNNHEVKITRSTGAPLIVEIDGKLLSGSSKKDIQEILETEVYDVPKMAILKMCLISFNAFNSLASMSASETKQFLDDVFGFKLFTEYNNEINIERKQMTNERTKLEAVYNDTLSQIESLKKKKELQIKELQNELNIGEHIEKKNAIIEEGKQFKIKANDLENKCQQERKSFDDKIKDLNKLMTQEITLGKEARKQYETFKSGICPTCGQQISGDVVNNYKENLDHHVNEYKKYENELNTTKNERDYIVNNYNSKISELNSKMSNLRSQINEIDKTIAIYDNGQKLIKENFDDLIVDNEVKAKELKIKIDHCEKEIGEWNEMNDLFSKTLRYNLLDTLIPHINKSINFFISKLNQTYVVKYDKEFKTHIFVEGFDKEISYNNLSTGQRKSLDIAIIFGILKNIIANVDFNILFLDELFSNMDANTRNIMLGLLNETMTKGKSVFVVNHAEMSDDFFTHKIRVTLANKKITSNIKGVGDVVMKESVYNKIF